MSKDPYVYPGTNILKNIPCITDARKFHLYESRCVLFANSAGIPTGDFSANHFKIVHKHLFGKVYSWAGETRQVNLTKGGSLFASHNYIDRYLNKILNQIQEWMWNKGLGKKDFVHQSAHFINELNAIHPFREGNGRTLRAFMVAVANQHGYQINYNDVGRDAWLGASIQGHYGNDKLMVEVLNSIVQNSIGKSPTGVVHNDILERNDFANTQKPYNRQDKVKVVEKSLEFDFD